MGHCAKYSFAQSMALNLKDIFPVPLTVACR